MRVAETITELRAARSQIAGTVGLVPTMGALHAGHLSLVTRARAENEAVIVTIFVNPLQFGPTEDFAAYPRDLASDLKLLENSSVDLVFAPAPDVMYPPEFQTTVEVGSIGQILEGAHRPGHFRGVATVIAKLFNLVQPQRAYFGQKDAQQVVVVRQMIRDLNFPVELVVCPIVRDDDGLALSSRNVYLTSNERHAAPVLYRALRAAAAAYRAGERNPEALRQVMRETLATEPLAQPDYVSVADAETLVECSQRLPERALLSMAVRIGRTRLIDNLLLPDDAEQL